MHWTDYLRVWPHFHLSRLFSGFSLRINALDLKTGVFFLLCRHFPLRLTREIKPLADLTQRLLVSITTGVYRYRSPDDVFAEWQPPLLCILDKISKTPIFNGLGLLNLKSSGQNPSSKAFASF